MKSALLITAFVFAAAVSGSALAADNDAQTVTFEVQAISEIAVSGNPDALVINSAVPGSELTPATDATTTYAITTNGSNKKITGKLDSAMPANTSLRLTLAAPSGAASAGQVILTASDQDLVTGISTLAESGLTASYEFTATISAGIIASSQKTVTLTITDGAV